MPPAGFGLLPVRSPLLRESSLFLGVLRCFSSPGALLSCLRCPAVRRAGCPIRRSPDHWLPAPPRGISPRGRVLRRPPTPRHPPCAHHADSCASFPSSRRRCRDSRPARARGTCPSWLGTVPMSRTPIVPDSLVMFRDVCIDVCIYAVRAGDPPRAPGPPPFPVRPRSRVARSPITGPRRLPRPQNLTGSAWRVVNVHQGANPS